eukprot:SAG22_NODE_370_length_11576_cov_83.771456_4_plen_2189_part_00
MASESGGNHHFDERGNPITSSLSFGEIESHYHTSAGKIIRSSSPHSSSLLIICMLVRWIPVDAGYAYGSGIPFSTEPPFAGGSCHLPITDQSTCSQHTDCDAVHMSCNGSISVCTSKSASCTIWETARYDDESVPPFSLTVGHDSLTHIEESYNSESSSDRSQVKDQLTCSQSAASSNGNQTRNRTHGDVSDVGGIPETSKSHGGDVEDETVENVLVFDTGLETPCVGHWIIVACILLRWYCRPKNLEKRPRYLRTRFELEALDTKPEVYRVSRSLRRCVALATIRKRFRAWRIDTKNEKYDRIGHVVGVAFLLMVMFQPVAEGSAVVSMTSTSKNVTKHHNETGGMNETNFHTDMNQLAALNVDPELKEFIGSLFTGFRGARCGGRQQLGVEELSAAVCADKDEKIRRLEAGLAKARAKTEAAVQRSTEKDMVIERYRAEVQGKDQLISQQVKTIDKQANEIAFHRRMHRLRQSAVTTHNVSDPKGRTQRSVGRRAQVVGSSDSSVLRSARVGTDRSVKACAVHPCELSDGICQNGGTCVEVAAEGGGAVPFECQCAGNFGGYQCETDLCQGVVCEEHSECLAGACECSDGWTGDRCATCSHFHVSSQCNPSVGGTWQINPAIDEDHHDNTMYSISSNGTPLYSNVHLIHMKDDFYVVKRNDNNCLIVSSNCLEDYFMWYQWWGPADVLCQWSGSVDEQETPSGVTVGTQAWIRFRCGGDTGRRLLGVKNDLTLSALPMKSDDSIASQFKRLDSKSVATVDFADPLQVKEFLGTVVTKLFDVQVELEQVKRGNEALENKIEVIETALMNEKRITVLLKEENQLQAGQIAALQTTLHHFSNTLSANTLLLQTDVQNMSVRLDQCEVDTRPFIKEMQVSRRRRLQEEETLCRVSGLIAMFSACCPSSGDSGGHRRFMQSVQGCDTLPSTCSATCAPLFIECFEGCQGVIDGLTLDQRQSFVGFYTDCNEVEQAAAAMLEDARPAMIFHVVVVDQEAEQQAAMANGGSDSRPSHFGPVDLPPLPSPAGGAVAAQEFRQACTTANLTVCVPQCNSFTYGFLLSIEIDGRGTVMTCNKMEDRFSWQGQASLGGYIGGDGISFFSAVSSGAAGTYVVVLTESPPVSSVLTVEVGQTVNIHGGTDSQLAWGTCLTDPPTGLCNTGFEVKEAAQLLLDNLLITGRMLVFGGNIRLHGCRIQGASAMAFPRDSTCSDCQDTINDHDGGGLKLLRHAVVSVLNCQFVENYGREGAAIYAERTVTLTVEQTTFTRNFGGAPPSSFIVQPDTVASGVRNYGNEIMMLKRRCGSPPCPWSGHATGGGYTNAEANSAQPLFAPGCTMAFPSCVGRRSLQMKPPGKTDDDSVPREASSFRTEAVWPDYESMLETVQFLQARSMEQDSKLEVLQKDNAVMKGQMFELTTRMGKWHPLPGWFEVISGPCTTLQNGRCAGRPAGYLANEQCASVVRGAGEALARCPVFDTCPNNQDPVNINNADCSSSQIVQRCYSDGPSVSSGRRLKDVREASVVEGRRLQAANRITGDNVSRHLKSDDSSARKLQSTGQTGMTVVLQRLDSLEQQVQAQREDRILAEAVLRQEVAVVKNKAQMLETENTALKKRVAALENKTTTDLLFVRADMANITLRLDQCEIDTHQFIKDMERRRMQDEETLCRGPGLRAMFAACCPSSGDTGGHRRFLQGQGCDTLPDTCPATCAPLFIEFFEGCQDMVNDLTPAEQQEFAGLYADCNEVEQQSAMANLQPVDVKMFRITIDQEAEQQAAMANEESGAPSPPFGPVVLPPSGSPPSPVPTSGEATEVQEYHAQCTTQNILTCVPACNATHHGFELLATIDGTGTKFSCNLANEQYSWVGAAALGGFLGQNVAAFVSAVISGAAGTYVLTLTEDANVGTDLVIQPGQHVIISGDVGLAEAPRWGSGNFVARGSLAIAFVWLSSHISVDRGSLTLSESVRLSQTERLWQVCVDEYGGNELHGGSITIGSTDASTTYSYPAGCTGAYSEIGNEIDCVDVRVTRSQIMVDENDATNICQTPRETIDATWRNAGSMDLPGVPASERWTNHRDIHCLSNRWFQIDGAAGDGLATSPPEAGLWLTNSVGEPSHNYEGNGVYPSVAEGIVTRYVCNAWRLNQNRDTCLDFNTVQVVNCGDHFLWRLPSTGRGAYTTQDVHLSEGRRLSENVSRPYSP